MKRSLIGRSITIPVVHFAPFYCMSHAFWETAYSVASCCGELQKKKKKMKDTLQNQETSGEMREAIRGVYFTGKSLHFPACLRANPESYRRQLARCRHTFRSCQLAPQKCDSGEIQTEQEQESKRAEGENMAAKNYHFNIKRMLSQQSNRATPFNCDTIQLLITASGARQKATVSRASTMFIK